MGHLSAPASDTRSHLASDGELQGGAQTVGRGHGGKRGGTASPAACHVLLPFEEENAAITLCQGGTCSPELSAPCV